MFLEFPNATSDGHPFDIDASNEFLFGPDILVAPAPFPEKPFSYEVKLPAVDWYDYWTGKPVSLPGGDHATSDARVTVHPELDQLPVFIRAGAILPMQPLTQSTSETPQGPLTLRVYPGKDCDGTLYLDDGISLAYARGDYLRMQFACEKTASGVRVHVSEHTGTYQPWWKQLRVEVYGWSSPKANALVGGKELANAPAVDGDRESVSVELPDTGHGVDLELRRPTDTIAKQ
jgi:alpha-glucosidase